MKKMIEQWQGTFLVDSEKKENLKDWQPKDGEQFKLRLLAPRRAEKEVEKK